jgi:choline-glycine betaine transporter
MAHLRRLLRFIAIVFYFVIVYAIVIVLTPLALVVLAIAFVIETLKLRDDEKQASPALLAWFILISVSGMVINLLIIPVAIIWHWIRGKPMPHPLD